MPVYVYKNLTTGATFEVEQRITEAALTADPATGDPVKRVIQPVGIAFKGSGFYVTDSRGKNAASKPAGKAPTSPRRDAPPPPPPAASAPVAASGTD
jgi:predicted nucleic acid-binding Zn ribbon protein